MREVDSFYDALAPWYHLVYQDWEATIGRQGRALSALLAGGLTWYRIAPSPSHSICTGTLGVRWPVAATSRRRSPL